MQPSFPNLSWPTGRALIMSVLFLLPAVAIGQQSLVDSLRQQWVQGEVNTEQLEQLLELAKATSDTDLEETLALAEYGKSKEIGDGELLAKCLNNKAVVLIDQGDYHGGLKLHLEVLQVREPLGDKDKLGYSCNYIAEDLYFLERFEESIRYGKRAVEYFKAAGNKEGLALAYENIAWSIQDEGDEGKALDYIDKALAIVGRFSGRLQNCRRPELQRRDGRYAGKHRRRLFPDGKL